MFVCLHKRNPSILFLIYNSLILFSHKKYIQLSINSLISCPKKSFSSQQKHFNLQFNVNYSHTRANFSFVRQTFKKLHQTSAIK